MGCIMYADDLVLISASLCNLQAMVDICSFELESIGVKLNVANRKLKGLDHASVTHVRGLV